jgi:hypothetical protein
MKKIRFTQDVLPHLLALVVFLIVALFFFKPIFFDHKALNQYDIQQWEGSSKGLRDFRDQTGEEGLWASQMFSGMPAYLINVEWGNQAVQIIKQVMTLSLPHPVSNIFAAFISYYILLLCFGVRPYLAIAGAVAFGLSSYIMIGLMAGHNGRVGAIAFMPLIMAGIHLVFSRRFLLGCAVTATGFALHLRENHLQMTYYLGMIVAVYGVVQLIYMYKSGAVKEWFKAVGLLVPAVALGFCTFLGPLWAITEYTPYSMRGNSELVSGGRLEGGEQTGLYKEYTFEFSNALLEPMTLLIPDIYGGASSTFLFQDQESETFKALSESGSNETANQLAQYTSAYWGPQRLAAPYYAGAVVVFLFIFGMVFGDSRMRWWLVSLTIFSIALSWGKNFEAFNYAMFDYFPGYNKFRSVTFTLIIALFAMPLLGFTALEQFLSKEMDAAAKKKLLIAGGITAGLCVLTMLFAGTMSFTRDFESQLPLWFTKALADDRKSLLMSDAFRSLVFVLLAFAVLYFNLAKVNALAFFAAIFLLITIDLSSVDKRYLKDESYVRSRGKGKFIPTDADNEILKDKSNFRVYNLSSYGEAWNDARTSYFHHSLGGYHGAKLRRYQDLLDSCLNRETAELINDAQAGGIKFENYGILNMLNTKYLVIGPERTNVVPNVAANGSAWFVQNVVKVNSPAEELKATCDAETKTTAVIDVVKFPIDATAFDNTGTIRLVEQKPNYMKYECNAGGRALAVFSEIFYEKGWKATIDQKEVSILRADYILRALQVEAGQHTIEFRFQPAAYYTGNKITMASSWLLLVVLLGSIGFSLKKDA